MLDELQYKHNLNRFYYWLRQAESERSNVRPQYYQFAVSFGERAKDYETKRGLDRTKLQMDLEKIIIKNI